MEGHIDGQNKTFHPGAPHEGETIQVYLNGMRLRYGTDYTVVEEDGAPEGQVIFTDAPLPGDSLEFEYLKGDQFEPGEELSGDINGSNTVFRIHPGRYFQRVTTRLFKNGMRMELGDEYTERGTRKVETVEAPAYDDDLIIDYIKGEENWPMVFRDPPSSAQSPNHALDSHLREMVEVNGDWEYIENPHCNFVWASHSSHLELTTSLWPLIYWEGILYAVRQYASDTWRLEAIDLEDGSLEWSFNLPGSAATRPTTPLDLNSFLYRSLIYVSDKDMLVVGGMEDGGGEYCIAIDADTHNQVWKKYDYQLVEKYDEETGYLYARTYTNIKRIDPDNGNVLATSPNIAGVGGLDYFMGAVAVGHGNVYIGGWEKWDGSPPAPGVYAYLCAFDAEDLTSEWTKELGLNQRPINQVCDDDRVYFAIDWYPEQYDRTVRAYNPSGTQQWFKDLISPDEDGIGFTMGQTQDHIFIYSHQVEHIRIVRKSDGEGLVSVTHIEIPFPEWGFNYEAWCACNEDYFIVPGIAPGWGYEMEQGWTMYKVDGTPICFFWYPEIYVDRIRGPILTHDTQVIALVWWDHIFCVDTAEGAPIED